MRKNISERTDELAHRLRCSRRDLAGKIGISQAMLFAYRSGKSEPTLKFLRKLEAAETAAGIEAAPPVSRCTDTLKKGSNAETAAGIEAAPPVSRCTDTLKKGSNAENSANPNDQEKGCEELLPVLERIAEALERIEEQLRKG